MRCATCDFDNPARFRFCGGCGAPLADEEQQRQTPAHPIAPVDLTPAERRHLTVMFCDLVGFTPLTERVDPEDLRGILQEYQRVCSEIVGACGGYVARYIGDALLCYFGFPRAWGDDAARAVRAARAIVDTLPDLNARLVPRAAVLATRPLQVRIGIQTGMVVVGDMGTEAFRDPMAVVGETPNVAARLQTLAQPGMIVIGAATHRLIEGEFISRELGPQVLKGVSTPVVAYAIERVASVRSRFEATRGRGLSPFVNRETEVAHVTDRWRMAQRGAGQVILLSGEPGIGKSRLLLELKRHSAAEPCTVLEGQCSAYAQNSAFHPVIGLVRQALHLDESGEQPPAPLVPHLHGHDATPDDVALLAHLLAVPLGNEGALPRLSPQRLKLRTQEAVVALLLRMGETDPVLLIVEDVHWADPSTVEFLTLLTQRVVAARLLVVLAFRPDLEPPWQTSAHVSRLTLGRLNRSHASRMIAAVTAGRTLPAAMSEQLLTRTDGVPLFVEELTKTVLESGLLREAGGHYELTGPLPMAEIPATLHDSLLARLDRLGPVRDLAQLGAVLGREFSFALLHAVADRDEATLRGQLVLLTEAELLYQRGNPPQDGFVFKHALIQEAAYQSLLKTRRQQLHRRVADVLREHFPVTVAERPELFAHHCTEGALFTDAVGAWQAAGVKALERSTNVEAVNHFTRGLHVLDALPSTPERLQQELAMRVALGAGLIATRGYAAAEVEQVYSRARVLCRELGNLPQLFPALLGLCGFYLVRAELQAAREMGEQVEGLARAHDDESFHLLGHFALGPVLFWLGELSEARRHLEEGIAIYRTSAHAPLAFAAGFDVGVVCRSYAAVTLWFLGYPDQAVTRIGEALALAEELAHPHSTAVALAFAAWLHQFRGEPEPTRRWADALIQLSREQDFAYWLAQGCTLRGWALAEEGSSKDALTHLSEARAIGESTGSRLGRMWFRIILAGTYARAQQPEVGLAVLGTEEPGGGDGEDSFYEAECHRLTGELLLQACTRGDRADTERQAQARFERAIAVAQQQGAKSLELRAVTSLTELWRRQGRSDAARSRLQETCDWFREGFDTPDLARAQALLAALA